MIQRLIAGKDAPPPSKKKKRELKERLEKRQWNPFDTPADYVHQSWQLAPGTASGTIVLFNTQTYSYITAPSSMLTSNLPSPPAHSRLLDLTEGVNPANYTDALIYGGVPGGPTNVYMQWVITQNSDNSIGYSSLFILLDPLVVFSFFQMDS